jgi:hypothetical protein
MGTPPVYWQAGGGDLYILPYIHNAWSSGQTSLKFYGCYCGGRASRSFSLAKEVSGAAFCSLPPPTLGLRHRLRLRPGTAVAPGGGRSLYSCICPSKRPFGGELSNVFCMPGWIFRRRATASATAPFGPWPCSSLDRRSLRPSPVVLGRDAGLGWGARHHRPQHQEKVVFATKWSPRA